MQNIKRNKMILFVGTKMKVLVVDGVCNLRPELLDKITKPAHTSKVVNTGNNLWRMVVRIGSTY